MESRELAEKIAAFAQSPNPAKAMAIIGACQPFVIKQAYSWQNSQMSMFERMREIMAEMFLILLEDFRGETAKEPQSMLSYLNLKLRRLTRPPASKATAFGLVSDMADLGRCEFKPGHLQLTREIVAAVRRTLAEQSLQISGLLELLFIHVYPEIAWASRWAAFRFGENVEARHDADRKRHLVFNRKLRQSMNLLPSGDWREIHDWSSSARMYLAERIIEFAYSDLTAEANLSLPAFNQWRQTLEKKSEVSAAELASAENIFIGLKKRWVAVDEEQTQNSIAAEEAAEYGESADV
ncbi:MAG: hypothetical protein ACOYXC_09280, partial [Candidatus Rifleibacteriota bacterium]